MKVVLASYAGETRYFDFLIPDRGIAQLAAILTQRGVDLRIYDLNRIDLTFGRFLFEVESFQPDVVGFKFFDTGFSSICTLAGRIRDTLPSTTIVAGGPHVSLFREHILHSTNVFDLVIYGEGERALVRLLDAVANGKSYSDIPGAIFRDDTGIIITTPQDLIRDLDELPMPRWDLLDLEMYLPIIMLNVYRGCPLTCAFCAHNRTWGYKERENSYTPIVRHASVGKVMAEITYATESLGVRSFGFTDSTPIPSVWRTIAREIICKNYNIAWTSFAYVGDFDNRDFSLFKKSGCAALWYGLESGDPELRSVMGKHFSNADIHETFRLARTHDIVPIPGFILNFPGETDTSFAATVHMAKELDAPVTVFSPYILDPGTPVAMNPNAYQVSLEPDWECTIVKRVGLTEFEIPYYRVDGIDNVTRWKRLLQTGVYPGFEKDRVIAESEYGYLLASTYEVDPKEIVASLDNALKLGDIVNLRSILDSLR